MVGQMHKTDKLLEQHMISYVGRIICYKSFGRISVEEVLGIIDVGHEKAFNVCYIDIHISGFIDANTVPMTFKTLQSHLIFEKEFIDEQKHK